MIWQKALLKMREKNIDNDRISLIQALHRHSPSTVLVHTTLSKWFSTTIAGVGYHSVSLTSFLGEIMSNALECFKLSIPIRGRRKSNLRFPDYIDLMEESQEKLAKLINRLDKAMAMQISTAKSKVVTTKDRPRFQKLDGDGNATKWCKTKGSQHHTWVFEI